MRSIHCVNRKGTVIAKIIVGLVELAIGDAMRGGGGCWIC